MKGTVKNIVKIQLQNRNAIHSTEPTHNYKKLDTKLNNDIITNVKKTLSAEI